MPSWAIHLAVTKKLNQKNNLNVQNKNIFLLGNIIPDILNGYVIKNISHVVTHKETHIEKLVQIGTHTEYRYDLEGFVNTYRDKFENPLILGYYTHLLTDFYWNNLTYGKMGIFDEDKNLIGLKLNNGDKLIAPKENLRKTKTNDFNIFSKYIYKNHLADVPKFDEKMLENAKQLDWLNIQKQDILEAIKYLQDMASLKTEFELEEKEYKIFSEEKMMENLENCVNLIEENLYIKHKI